MATLSSFPSTHNAANLAVKSRRIDQLRPHPRCPRTHPPRQIKKLAANIKAYGFLIPVLIDENSQILAGHARVLAATKLGMIEIPTIAVEHLSESQANGFMIADNKLGLLSSWDDQRLGELLLDLSVDHLDFALELTGFDMPEIDLRIEGLSTPADAQANKADALPEPTSEPPVTRQADLWVLGRHRLLCASALEAESYALLMDGEKATTVFTDPPYNVPIAGHVSGLGRVKHEDFVMGCGELSRQEFTNFLRTSLGLCAKNSIDGAVHFVTMDWRHLPELLAAAEDVYSKQLNLCVWSKPRGGMGSLYRSRHELVGVFKVGKAPHRNNVELGRHGRNRTNVWEYPSGHSSEEGRLLHDHPTPKPTGLVSDALLDCSARGDLVLDAFLGSGTTLIAAERVGRRCNGLELSPVFVDVIVRRWEKFTGDQARLASTGLSFAEVSACRAEGDVR